MPVMRCNLPASQAAAPNASALSTALMDSSREQLSWTALVDSSRAALDLHSSALADSSAPSDSSAGLLSSREKLCGQRSGGQLSTAQLVPGHSSLADSSASRGQLTRAAHLSRAAISHSDSSRRTAHLSRAALTHTALARSPRGQLSCIQLSHQLSRAGCGQLSRAGCGQLSRGRVRHSGQLLCGTAYTFSCSFADTTRRSAVYL